MQGDSDKAHSVAFSPDGKRVVSGSGDLHVKIWDAETGAEVCSQWGGTCVIFLARPEASVHSID